jgi:hypothetical protein
MAPGERSEIIDILEKSREEFQAAANGVPESLANARPEADRWSVLECVEHVATVEEVFLGRIAGPVSGAAPPSDRMKEAALTARVVDRSERRQAPEAIWPKGRFTSLAEGLEQFHAARGRTVQFARDNAANLYALTAAHPAFGPLNGVEALTLIAAHARRHAAQIREVRAVLEKR